MIIRDLQALQELVIRTWVRMMLLATLPYHLSQDAARDPTPESASAVADDRCRAISIRLPYGNARDDARWLR